ncbi:hypothetical protein [Phytoactinopolyspora limicola]|uniref:hypothetical protein n=1 Tax=Phytoactinopolyspora limicola TaxID=2715536 RepID=UPI00140B94C0|nr:hypothetical protein [Phytoactinopolyspora limicola]
MTLCRTPEDAFRAGWDDGASDTPLTDQEINRLVALHGRFLRATPATPQAIAS